MSYKCLAFAGQEDFRSNIVHLSNVGSMLGQRRRRWPNIKTPLDQCLVWVVSCNQFSGYINAVNLYSIGYCWPTLDRPRHARFEAEWFFNIKKNCISACATMHTTTLETHDSVVNIHNNFRYIYKLWRTIMSENTEHNVNYNYIIYH